MADKEMAFTQLFSPKEGGMRVKWFVAVAFVGLVPAFCMAQYAKPPDIISGRTDVAVEIAERSAEQK
jgi:hypothetical protein